MWQRVVDFSLRNRGVILGGSVLLGAWGLWALLHTPIDAIPDLSDNQVIVFTDWLGRSPQEVEDQVTYPLTTNLRGLAGVRVVRSQSAFGFSMIYVIFEDGVDTYFARARVLERLAVVGRQLPDGAVPTLGPDATGVGHVFWYTLESDQLSLRELRTVQDWFVRYQLSGVPGVAEVASVGGQVEQYQIDVDPNRLRQYRFTLSDIVRAVSESNSNVGGNILESNGAWTIIRGIGLLTSVDDLKRVALRASAGAPVLLQDVADVHIGDAFRVAALVKGSHEAVGGVVVARTGANAREVITAIKAKIADITPALPGGTRLIPFYDRSQLINGSIDTLRITLLEEVLLVTLAHLVFLRHLRSVLAVTLPLPLAVLTTFLLMHYGGITSNIMSLAGIAIAIGVLVDAAIVVTQNSFRSLENVGVSANTRGAVDDAIRRGTTQIVRPVMYSMAIILAAFLPVLTLIGQEGKLFRPLAWTKTFAVFAATVFAITLVPVLCSLLLRGHVHREQDNIVMRGLRRLYAPCLSFALRRSTVVFAAAALLFSGSILAASRIGSEFMPPLNEGDLLFMPIADPAISLDGNIKIAERQNAALLAVPEVSSVVAKIARADTSTDPAPLNMTESVVTLRPPASWRRGLTLSSLKAELARAVQYPGVTGIWTMPIVNRIDMLTTGIRSELGLKIFGGDLATLERMARQVADVLRTVPGAQSVYPEQLSGAQYLNVRINREAIARYGLTVSDVQRVIDTAIGETTTTTVIDGRRRVPVRVRYAPAFRSSPQALAEALVWRAEGSVPLGSVATFESVTGPSMIPSENGSLVVTVLINVAGRDLGRFVSEATTELYQRLKWPSGSYYTWSGQYESQTRARDRLLIAVPIAIAITLLLLYFAYRSWSEAAHVMLAVPFALTGGLYLLWWSGYNFSVAVWVGFIALFGTAVQTGMLMVFYLQEALERTKASQGGRLNDRTLREAVIEGALLRLRPKVMTTSTVVLSLLPIMWTSRVGSEVLRPIATPVLGGMVSSLIHVLIITPVVFFALQRRRAIREGLFDSSPESPGVPVRRYATTRNMVLVLALAVLGGIAWWWVAGRASGAPNGARDLATLARVEADGFEIRAMGAAGALRVGRSGFSLEIRDKASGALVDADALSVSGSMSMPGMPMTTSYTIRHVGSGRYEIAGEYGMAGPWRVSLSWQGPRAGRATMEVEVH